MSDMTKKEAIKWIKQIKHHYIRGGDEDYDNRRKESLDMAIESLQGDLHCPKCGTIVRDGRQYHDLVYRGEAEKLQLSPETSTNGEETSTTSKTETVDTSTNTPTNTPTCNQTCNKKQVTGKLNNPDDSLLTDDSEACKEQKSKLDCISRQQAIEEIKTAATITGWNKYASQEEIVDDVERQLRRLFVGAIESLPPVTPTERTGEWVFRTDIPIGGGAESAGYVCSECKAAMFKTSDECPNCGAKMKGGTENE